MASVPADGERVVELHGLRVSTRLDLHARSVAGPADIHLVVGDPREVQDCGPGEEVVGRMEWAGRPLLTVLRHGAGWRLVLERAADAIFAADAARVVLHPGLGTDVPIDEIAAGPVMALALAVRGTPALHASAVVGGAGAVAIAGPSGSGKTTLAALACTAGATLLTDDTLVVTRTDGEFLCLPGSCQLRLRPAAAPLAPRLPGDASTTRDGRLGVTVGPDRLQPAPLRAIVVPVRSGQGSALHRITGTPAVRALLAAARTPAFGDPKGQLEFFRLASDLAADVPVYELPVGGGGSPPAELPASLADLLFPPG